MRQIQGGARYVEAFKCLASEFYGLYFSLIDTFRRDFLPPSVGYVNKPRVGITDYTWVWECQASHCVEVITWETGVKGMIILKVYITAAGCEVVERTKIFHKVLGMVYYLLTYLLHGAESFLRS